jgi:hypothetical protein
MTYRFLRTGLMTFAIIASACTSSTEPTEGNLLGCHALATTALTNGAPASSMVVRLHPDTVEVLSSKSGTPSAGLNRGGWRLEDDGRLRMWFSTGFVGVNYTFDDRRFNRWFGDVHFWLDTPGGGDGTAVLTRAPCP